jgi:hypothetical protein
VRRMILRWAGELAERYPIPAGILLMLFGLFMLGMAFKEGPRLAEFDGGERVTGQVVTAGEDPSLEPRFAADVTWPSEGRVPWEKITHRGRVAVLSRELPDVKARDPERRLRPGSEVALVISTKNPDAAISAQAFEEDPFLKLAGFRVLTIPLVMGLVCLAGGLGGVIQAVLASRRRPPRPAPRARPAPARPLRR